MSMRALLVFSVGLGLAVMLIGCSQGTDIVAPEDMKANMSNLPPDQQVLVAAETGDTKTLEALLQSDATLGDVRGNNGVTPLHLAARNGHDAAVKILLETGADPLAEDDESNTAANMANVEGHPGTAQIIQDFISSGQ
ncbi:MAG: ankyrin repeat domain-containing protein [Candidatus Hydrogenedentes bacterium]|nr:ankyrin repeat domain-containing protein [Candidatus Hydrogenedentota bacterium]